jgi:hypothetical protein
MINDAKETKDFKHCVFIICVKWPNEKRRHVEEVGATGDN